MASTKKVTIYTDGASRNNPGISASGYLIFDDKSNVIAKSSVYNGILTNNEAEYNAIFLALEWCAKNLDNLKEVDIKLFSDSELVVSQLNGTYKIKSKNLKESNKKVKDVESKFKLVIYTNVSRENEFISKVDKALNQLLDSMQE